MPLDTLNNLAALGEQRTKINSTIDEINSITDGTTSGGIPVTATGTTTPRTLSDWTEKEILSYNTIAAAKTDAKLEVGQRVKTYGYVSVGDGGNSNYVVVAGATGTDDGGSYHNMSNGNQLKLLPNKYVDVRVFGVRNDAAYDLTAIQNCANYCASNGLIMTGNAGTTALLSNRFTLPSGLIFIGDMTVKATTTNSSTNGTVFGITAGVSGIKIRGVTFDGGSTEGNTNLLPLSQVFQGSDIDIRECTFKNSYGIANNISTNTSDITIEDCDYENIGFSTGVGGANAKQAITFSSGGHTNVTVKGNGFKSIGLDCISIGGITGGDISENRHDNDSCYTLIYNADASYDLTIARNRAKTAVNVGGSDRPQGLGIDLPLLFDSSVYGNICNGCSSAGIGIFSGSANVSVTSNTTLDNNQSAVGIHDAGIIARAVVGPINISGNISGNRAGSTQGAGYIIDNAQGSGILVDRSNKAYSVTNDVVSATFASPTDISTTVFTYSIPLELTGNGTPESVVTAPIGSVFTRLDGGAGTTFYYKESGAGNTGWIAK